MTMDCSVRVILSQPYKPQIDFGYASFSVLYSCTNSDVTNPGPFILKNANDTCVRDYYSPLRATITPHNKQSVDFAAENHGLGYPVLTVRDQSGYSYNTGMDDEEFRTFNFDGIPYLVERHKDKEFKMFNVYINCHEFR